MTQDIPGAPADDQRAASNSVLLNTFVVKKKRCRVYFHRGTLIWETERPPYSKRRSRVSSRKFLIARGEFSLESDTFLQPADRTSNTRTVASRLTRKRF